MSKSIKLSKRDLDESPEFWATFDLAAAEENKVDVRGQSFQLKLRYMSEAEYQRRVQKKAEVKEKGVSTKLAPASDLGQLAELQAKLVVLDWKMPLDRFNLSVPLSADVIAPHILEDKGIIDPEVMVDFDQETCARFLKSGFGYTNFVHESCTAAYEANAKREDQAVGN